MPTLNITVDIPPTCLLDTEAFKQRVTTYANSLIALHHTHGPTDEHAENIFISDRIKAMETGFQCPGYASEDYKDELHELKAQRHL